MAWIPNVNPNELITSSWGNLIRDHVVNTFANAAARDSAIPTPVAGMACHLADVSALQVHNGTAWKSIPAGYLGSADYVSASGNVSNSAVAIPTFSVAYTLPTGGRRVRVSITSTVLQTGVAGMVRTYVREGATDLVTAFTPTPAVNGYYTVSASRVIGPTVGSHTYQVYMSTDAGTVSVQGAAGTCSLDVEDVGT